jgi:hypothetical protein
VLPQRGAAVWKVPGSEGLVLAVAPDAVSPSVSPDLIFQFPKSAFVTGVLALLRPDAIVPLDVQRARTALRIVDETSQPIFSDTRGTLQGTTNAQVAVGLMALEGFAVHPFSLQRPVAALDRWIFQLQNADTLNTAAVAGIFLYFDEAFHPTP